MVQRGTGTLTWGSRLSRCRRRHSRRRKRRARRPPRRRHPRRAMYRTSKNNEIASIPMKFAVQGAMGACGRVGQRVLSMRGEFAAVVIIAWLWQGQPRRRQHSQQRVGWVRMQAVMPLWRGQASAGGCQVVRSRSRGRGGSGSGSGRPHGGRAPGRACAHVFPRFTQHGRPLEGEWRERQNRQRTGRMGAAGQTAAPAITEYDVSRRSLGEHGPEGTTAPLAHTHDCTTARRRHGRRMNKVAGTFPFVSRSV